MQPDLPCFCVNLDERKDKWEATLEAFAGTGIVPQRFSAIKHTEGWRGCGASHVAIARKAMLAGLSWVLVIEDDCVPADDFAERWPAVRDALWEERDAWDIFLGGPTYVQGPAQFHGKHLVEIGSGFTNHFYVLNVSAYTKAIAWNPDRHSYIDVYYANQFRIVTTQPLLAYQRVSQSDIKHETVDYSKIFQDSERALEQLTYVLRTRSSSIVLVGLSLLAMYVIWKKRI
jgi:hypothetical protein